MRPRRVAYDRDDRHSVHHSGIGHLHKILERNRPLTTSPEHAVPITGFVTVVQPTKKKVSEIVSLPYGEDNVCCEPSREEVEEAIRENALEKGGFQEHLDELKPNGESYRFQNAMIA